LASGVQLAEPDSFRSCAFAMELKATSPQIKRRHATNVLIVL